MLEKERMVVCHFEHSEKFAEGKIAAVKNCGKYVVSKAIKFKIQPALVFSKTPASGNVTAKEAFGRFICNNSCCFLVLMNAKHFSLCSK